MTPMCENTKGMDYFDKVKELYPEIHNYENAVLEDKYFSSCGHLKDAGARLFTARILKDFFNK
jgi:glutathionyl-hydroquinone reductase